jgi:hypothetical protein
MRLIICVNIILFCVSGHVKAQAIPPFSLSQFNIPHEYGRLTNVKFSNTCKVEALQQILSVRPHEFFETGATFVFTNQFEQDASAPNLFYSIVQHQDSSLNPSSTKEVRSYKIAYNGKILQKFSHPEERLSIATDVPEEDPAAYLANGLFLPYGFVSEGQSKWRGEIGNLSALSSEATWKDVTNLIASGKYAVSGDGRYITFKLSRYNLSNRQNVSYEVTLDRKFNLYPIHWIMTGQNGTPIQEYAITEFGAVETADKRITLNYPKIATVSYFSNGTMISKATITLTDIELNAALDPDIFTFDPGSANQIWDDDKRVLIKVPK